MKLSVLMPIYNESRTLRTIPGHTTAHLLRASRLVVTDTDFVHVETLDRRFRHLENVEVEVFDPTQGPCEIEGIDTVLLLDGLQRSAEPKDLLTSVTACLGSGGLVLIQVPARERLYGPTDEAAGHLRRFDRDDLEDIIRAAGLELMWVKAFNRLGYLGWLFHRTVGAGRITGAETRGFDLMVPMAKRLEPIIPLPGLSYLAVARAP
ncbi:MAG: class I SAM-dependent methyltransferase [Actinobacteria bacterium]|nr:class I SAM-dependent methyltransferase [Actinomycetota bacterium]